MTTITTILVLLTVLALTAALAKRLPIPLPLLLILAGVGTGFVPAFKKVDIEPEVFFVLFISPLLFADGWIIPKRELLGVLRPVLLLAFGLVFLTVLGVGLLMHWMIPALPLAAAFALGAIVSPTDAVATSAMVGNAGLASRARHILNGESLINDASGLVAFRFALVALATGAFSWTLAAGDLVLVSVGGAFAGAAMAWIVGRIRGALRRHSADDPSVQTVLSVLTPFAAYLAAEHLHLSGILAVVTAGLYAGWNDFRTLDARTRRHAWEVWQMLIFVFNGMVFILLGITLTHVLGTLGPDEWRRYLGYAMVLWIAITVLRLIWVFPSTYLPQFLSKRVREREGLRDPRNVFLVGWAGLRGSVTMAAALSIPVALADGTPFPERHLLIFLAASTILLTLLINGLSLPLFVRVLGVRSDGAAERDLRAAEIAVSQAAALALEQEMVRLKRPEEIAHARDLLVVYSRRMDRHTANGQRSIRLADAEAAERRLMLVALEAERQELYALRDAGTINDETLRDIETRIDNAELFATGAAGTAH